MAGTAQTLNDRMNAVRYGLAGQGLAKSVCKATTEEPRGPKKKHLDYLLHCTEEPNVSVPQLANYLIERVQNTNWTVVFKALTTIHHLMLYGNERFVQYFASANVNLVDACNAGQQGRMAAPGFGGDLSHYTRKYANYLNQKALSYRMVAFDFCRAKRGRDEGILRKMNADQILKCLPIVQKQMDALLEFEITAAECSNSVVSGCFILLFRDLIRLFACYNDGIINLLEKYFEMNRKQCKEALEIYRRFLTRMDRVSEFLKVAENVGIPRGEIPDLTRAPSSLLEALEQHLNMLEGKPPGSSSSNAGAATSPSGGGGMNPSASLHAGLSNLSKTEASIGSVSEAEKQRILLEEEEAMRRMKEGAVRRLSGAGANNNFSNTSSPQRNPNNNNTNMMTNNNNSIQWQQQPQQQMLAKRDDFDPFGTAGGGSNNNAGDMFGQQSNMNSSRTQQQPQHQQQSSKPDIDLLLGDVDLTAANNNNAMNAFGNNMPASNSQQQFANFASFPQQQQQQQYNNNFQQAPQYTNGGGGGAQQNLFDPFGGNSAAHLARSVSMPASISAFTTSHNNNSELLDFVALTDDFASISFHKKSNTNPFVDFDGISQFSQDDDHILQPTNVMSPSSTSNALNGSSNNLQAFQQQNAAAPMTTGKQPLGQGGLDESLKNLVQNLNLTGGSAYGGRGAMSPTTASPKRAMNASMVQQQPPAAAAAAYQQFAAAAPGRPPPPNRPPPPQNPFM